MVTGRGIGHSDVSQRDHGVGGGDRGGGHGGWGGRWQRGHTTPS